MVISFFVSINYFFVGNSYAESGHTLGNGGDITELQTIEIWESLNQRLRPCLTTLNPCKISHKDSQSVSLLIGNFKDKGKIKFITTQEQWSYSTQNVWGSEIKINRNSLYQNKKPISFSELAKIVMEAAFFQLTKNREQSSQLADKIRSSWFVSSHEFITFIDSYMLTIKWIDLHQSNSQIYIDVADSAENISEFFLKNRICTSHLSYFKIINLFAFSYNEFLQVHGESEFNCIQKEKILAQFNMIVPYKMDKTPVILKDKIEIDLFNLRRLSEE